MQSSYPLQWPMGWPRAQDWQRKKGPFQMPAGKARYELSRELQLLGATNVVVSSNVMTRSDGLPYAKQPRTDDPGVVLYFTLKSNDVCIPCDRWNTIDANLRAIGMAVEAIRGMERWGTGQMVEAAFRGFKALPAEAIVTPYSAKPWYEVLEVSPNASQDVIEAAYRRLARIRHPDMPTGSEEAFKELRAAYEQRTQKAAA